MYFVEFKGKDDSQISSAAKRCIECDLREAEVYCENDDAILCSKCNEEIHVFDFNRDHNIVPILASDKMFLKTGKCVFDPENDVEFYCKTCNLAICSYCKVLGSHSRGNAASHLLEDIAEVYSKNNPNDSNNEFGEVNISIDYNSIILVYKAQM